jgi:aspartyl-tRNA(Asn)/glutamyl-tRNA(Gln) amidotransferase subunit A
MQYCCFEFRRPFSARDGLVSYASSLDTIGIIAPSPGCVAVVLDKLARQETHRDSTQTKPTKPMNILLHKEVNSANGPSLAGLKVGIPAAFSVMESPDTVRDAWLLGAQILERQGATIEIVSHEQLTPDVLQKALAAYYVLAVAEASSNLARYDGFRYGVLASDDWIKDDDDSSLSLLERQFAATRTQGFGREVIRRILCGTSVLSSDRFHTFYEAAAKLRAVLTRQLLDTLDDCDLLLVPTAIFPPPSISAEIDQTEMFANDVMTVPFSMAGLPAISVPVGRWDDSSPIQTGLQLVAARYDEGKLLRAAMALEAATEATA